MELAKSSQKTGPELGENQTDIGRCEPTHQEKQWEDWWKNRLEAWRGFLAEKALCESTSTNSFHADLYYCWQQSRSHQQLFHFHISFLHTPLRKKDGRPPSFRRISIIQPHQCVRVPIADVSCRGAKHVIYSTNPAQRDRTSIRKPCFSKTENTSEVIGSPAQCNKAFSEGCLGPFIFRGRKLPEKVLGSH